MRYEDYLKLVSDRLINDRFDQAETQIRKYCLDLFGISQEYDRGLWPYADGLDAVTGHASYRLVFGIASFPKVSIETIESFSKALYDYAFAKVSDSRFFHRIIVPVMATETVEDMTISYIKTYEGTLTRFPIVDITRPVLVDLDTDSISYDSKVTTKYYRVKKIAKEAIEKYLVVGNMKKL